MTSPTNSEDDDYVLKAGKWKLPANKELKISYTHDVSHIKEITTAIAILEKLTSAMRTEAIKRGISY